MLKTCPLNYTYAYIYIYIYIYISTGKTSAMALDKEASVKCETRECDNAKIRHQIYWLVRDGIRTIRHPDCSGPGIFDTN